MKWLALAVVSCIVASALAVPDVNYAGSTVLGTDWNHPAWTVDSSTGALTCDSAAPQNLVKQQHFNITVATTGFITVLALFEKSFIPEAELLVYDAAAFNLANTCNGLVFATAAHTGAPALGFYVYIPAGTYTVVVSGKTTGDEGLFVINTIFATAGGNTRNATKQWYYPSTSDFDSACSASSTAVNYNTFTWTPTTTGLYDVSAYFVNQTYTSTFYVAVGVFAGAFPNSTVAGVADPCTNGNYLHGDYMSTSFFAPAVAFTANVPYTFVVSGATDSDQIGDYGLFIQPTRTGALGNVANYTRPDVPSYGTSNNCSVSSNEANFDLVTFTAQQPVYIIDVSSSFDSVTVLYHGVYTTAPTTCSSSFILIGDTGDGGPVAAVLIPGQNYTAVVTRYGSSSSTSPDPFVLYALTGLPLGVPSVTTTGTTGGVTGVTAAATTGSSSSASSVAASLLLAVVAAVLAMF